MRPNLGTTELAAPKVLTAAELSLEIPTYGTKSWSWPIASVFVGFSSNKFSLISCSLQV